MMMKKRIMTLTAIAAMGVLMVSCKKNRSTDLELTISGLENLGADYVYEGWIIVDGSPVTTGVFTVNDAGTMSATSFEVNQKELKDAESFVLTIEPANDSDPSPSAVHILAGDFSGDNANLTVSHSAAIGTDFTAATGNYILATPTDGGDDTDKNSGVWFLTAGASGPSAGLNLPALADGWVYEGWAVVNGTPISTGTFTNTAGNDAMAPHSGASMAPPFPGEDLLLNAPDGVTFPTDLAGKTVVISVEPMPDNSTKPFTLKPLVGNVPAGATDHTNYTMNNNATTTNPTGTAKR